MEIKSNSDSSLSKIVVALICVALLCIGYIHFPLNILCWDVFGYYLYLPLTFIYHDLGLSDRSIIDTIIQQYHSTGSFYQSFQSPTGDWVMRYPIGLSIMYSPFFFIGHLYALVSDYPADGFSMPYQYAIWWGSMLFAFTGIIVLRKVLQKFFQDKIVAVLLIVLTLGTNYTLHTSIHGQGAMPHDYLFTLYSFILWFTIRWHETYKIKYALLLALVCGLAMLSRPSEIVALLIPIFWGVYDKQTIYHKINLIKEKKNQLIAFAIVLTALGFIQFTYWKIYTGSFLFDSYYNPGEGLDLFPPHTIDSLFSFRNGWLIYTPVMIFALIGFVFLYKKDKGLFAPFFIFFILNLWIVTSWTIWWNGPSFGQRYLIASYPTLAIPLGFFLTTIFEKKKLYKYSLGIILGFLICLNIFQSWQMASGILPTPRMTKAAYFAAFGETEIPENIEKMLILDPLAPGASDINETEYSLAKILVQDFENIESASKEIAFSKLHSFKIDSASIYSPNVEVKYRDLTKRDYVKTKITLQLYCTVDPKENPGSLVANFEHNGKSYGYAATDVEKQSIELNKWSTVTFNYLTPVIRSGRDKLKVYYWHRGKKPVYIDDLKVEVWEKNE